MRYAFHSMRIYSAIAAIFVGATFSASLLGAEPPLAWLTGEKFHAQLDQKISVSWSARAGVPFREALVHLAQAQQIAMVLDRRVDPDQKIVLASDDVSLDDTLKLIASKLSLGEAQVGWAIYLGPEATARRIRTVAALRHEEAAKLPLSVRSKFVNGHAWHWAEGSEPRSLLDDLAKSAKIEIHGSDQIPHDLWAAAELPSMNFTDRLTLIAAQYDLTFAIDPSGESVSLLPMPKTVEIQHDYALHTSPTSHDGDSLVKKLEKLLPDAKVSFAAGTLTVRGRAEDQDFVEQLLDGRPAKKVTVTTGEKRYTLPVVSMAVDDLVRTLGRRLNLDVQFDTDAIQAAGISLKTEVKVNVKNATRDELLHDVLDPAGLTFDARGTTIVVRPKK